MSIDIKFNSQVWNDIIKEAQAHLNIIAEDIKDEAKLNCPVLTGKLRNSIDITHIDDNTKDIGSEVPYAIFVEMGTIKQQPKAFLRNALDNVVEKL